MGNILPSHESAAKAVKHALAQFPGVWAGGRQREVFTKVVHVYGLRCAEAMRERCKNTAAEFWSEEPDTTNLGKQTAVAIVKAIERLPVEGG